MKIDLGREISTSQLVEIFEKVAKEMRGSFDGQYIRERVLVLGSVHEEDRNTVARPRIEIPFTDYRTRFFMGERIVVEVEDPNDRKSSAYYRNRGLAWNNNWREVSSQIFVRGTFTRLGRFTLLPFKIMRDEVPGIVLLEHLSDAHRKQILSFYFAYLDRVGECVKTLPTD